MEMRILVPLIAALATILTVTLFIWLRRRSVKRRKAALAALPPNVSARLEKLLREDPGVQQLLGHKDWQRVAEAAIAHLARGIECRIDPWRHSPTWMQIAAVAMDLKKKRAA